MYPFFLYLILYFKISSKTDAFLVEQHEKSSEEFFCMGHLLSLSESSLIFPEVLPPGGKHHTEHVSVLYGACNSCCKSTFCSLTKN
jgi:hypothetical protein